MRNTISWRKDLEKEFARNWESPSSLSPREMCGVELGLYLLEHAAPAEPAVSLWTLMTGYPFLATESQKVRRMLFNARHLLQRYKSRHLWADALDRYRDVKGSLRGYDVTGGGVERREVALCRNRFAVYESALNDELPFLRREVRWAEVDSYRMSDRRGNSYGVTLPDEACLPPPEQQHDLGSARTRKPLDVKWHDLIKTAAWMDEVEAEHGLQKNSWQHRLSRDGKGDGGVQLETFGEGQKLGPARELKLDGLTHLVGMVSSGKSTLMDVLTVWAVKRGLHVTLVVGDVNGALDRAQTFQRLGINAVPLLGSTRRAEHINNLHKALFARQHDRLLVHEHAGFRWLSTACPLDGMRNDDNPDPFAVDFRPCADLRPVQPERGAGEGAKYCPLYRSCPYHQGQRDLVEAAVWIATPASLVHTRVAEQINSESVRFAELVVRRSDLVIVDEADRVQVQLDEIFSPNQVLCSASGDGWLDNLEQRVGEQTGRRGRASVAGEQVETWRRAYHHAQAAADAVYKRLLGNPALREWIHELYFFTDFVLFDRLAREVAADPQKQNPVYKLVRHQFDELIDSGLRQIFSDRLLEEDASSGPGSPLSNFANRLLMSADSRLLRRELRAWVEQQAQAALDEDEAERAVERLEFALLISVLSNRLNFLFGRWKEVEDLLGLERSSSTLLYRPPLDYQALIPMTPVGNVLAFQYLHDELSGAATLKFLRCTGVGRSLLLRLHDLLSDEGVAGPHVLLLSGTSWAGGDPSYHLQVPVSGILRAPRKETEAIARSEFRFLPLRDPQDKAISISGRYGENREEALRQMLKSLARATNIGDGGSSILEKERDSLEDNRRRILLVVGSYKEAALAREFLERERPDWRDGNSVVQLVPDAYASGDENSFSKLPRGQVDQFAATNAWLLIAPLMAIERGHNILNEERVAAIGAAYFLVRPHPRPQDLSYAVRSLNKWAVDETAVLPLRSKEFASLDAAGRAWRGAANRRWRELLTTDFIHATLQQADRDLLTWNLMVSIWQIIGRLIRGGQPARVYFCDAKFDLVRSGLAQKSVSLLDEMRAVLQRYSESSTAGAGEVRERALVRELYGPLYEALENIRY